MKLLLDTHAFLWWITDNSLLSDRAGRLIADGQNEIFLSAASAWEIAIKSQLDRLEIHGNLEKIIHLELRRNNIQPLPVKVNHALRVSALPLYHRDPFDRLLIAQSQIENFSILTADPLIKNYSVRTIW